VRIMKWIATLLIGCFVLGSELPASAEMVSIDQTILDSVESHLDKALDGLDRLNLLKVYNHITRAQKLIGSSSDVPLGGFSFRTPFTWYESDGPMPVRIAALIDDGTGQPLYTGRVNVSVLGYGEIVALYDSNMTLLPGTQTTSFENGQWNGYIMLRSSIGGTVGLILSAFDSVRGVGGGNGWPFTWIVP